MKKSLRLIGASVIVGLGVMAFGGIAAADITPTPTVTPEVMVSITPTPEAPLVAKAANDCVAYRYTGTKQNLCDRFAGRSDVDCKEVGYQVNLPNPANDPWLLDEDEGVDDGLGCETYPKKNPTVTKSPTTNPPTSKPATTKPAPPVANDNDNDDLPVTGDNTGKAAVIGGILLVGGVIAVVVSRKRRTKFETN